MNAQRSLAERAVAYVCADPSGVAASQRRLDQLVADATRQGHTVHTRVCDPDPATVPLHERRGWATVVGAVEAGLADAVIVRSMSDLAVDPCDRIPIRGWLETAGAQLVTLRASVPGASWPALKAGTPCDGRVLAASSCADPQVQDYAAVRSSVQLGRSLIKKCLTMWGWAAEPSVVHDICLLTDELLANAILHGCRNPADTITMRVECDADRVQVSVSDPSSSMPRPCSPTADSESGRGLRLIAEVAEQWGVTPRADAGKSVWFAVSLPGRTSTS
ncbi:ATP-binding protein [Streptomyces sp. CSDS2]|uniref:ATP-binding protein n=1 Tax=Streptomyces sp. CSDS2 TaxID=3055051 RepID=UPI0025B0667C|nr:ATP-binding protein [Streptomyces sp. CSDS2]MDN3260798.1 ATP-binding protein [Streptomyces sp. CSDS2]